MTAARPARPGNPFATRHVRPGAVPYFFPEGLSAAVLVGRLKARGWWGAVVGPHGSGKSTLLATLLPALRAAARELVVFALHDRQRRLPAGAWQELARRPAAAGRLVVVVDGYEQLGAWEAWWLRRRCRRRGYGLLVTAHGPTNLPELWRTDVTPAAARRVVAHLRPGDERPAAALARRLAAHDGSLREVLFELYDDYEAERRCSGGSRVGGAGG